ncbi:MAG: 30S ribosomal protein S12 methylthiotransferase RimO, partial [Firmicutes bacterium]|nr:30S ribosomal protein S12 methylthiotransferase RimO [Bacillota bacterium]
VARTYGDAPDIDGYLFINTGEVLLSGDFVKVRVTGSAEYDLIGEIAE